MACAGQWDSTED